MNARRLRPIGMVLLVALGAIRPAAAQLTFSQASVFNDGSKTHGSSVNTQTISGVAVTLTYSTASSFSAINGATTFSALPLDSFFLGTDNVFGTYDYGFAGG